MSLSKLCEMVKDREAWHSFICNSKKLERARILCSRCMVKTAVLHPQGSSASSPQEVAVVHGRGQAESPKLRIPRGHALCRSRVGSGGLWAGSREGGTLRAVLRIFLSFSDPHRQRL